jgi:hypothetical protein
VLSFTTTESPLTPDLDSRIGEVLADFRTISRCGAKVDTIGSPLTTDLDSRIGEVLADFRTTGRYGAKFHHDWKSSYVRPRLANRGGAPRFRTTSRYVAKFHHDWDESSYVKTSTHE